MSTGHRGRFTDQHAVNLGLIKLAGGWPPTPSGWTLCWGAMRTHQLRRAQRRGHTTVTFSKTIREAEVERVFFTTLIELGVPVTIENNWRD